MLRVLLVDDHPVVRAGLRAVLEATGGITVVAEAMNADEAIEAVRAVAVDVVLMDLRLPGDRDGTDAARAISEMPSPPKVLILTTYETDSDILRAINAGAVGYLLKDADPAALIRAVHSAAAGETVLAPPVASRLMGRVQARDAALTSRELDIVRRLAEGGSNREIARGLCISEATVKSHLVHIFRKLGVDNRTRAIVEARRRTII